MFSLQTSIDPGQTACQSAAGSRQWDLMLSTVLQGTILKGLINEWRRANLGITVWCILLKWIKSKFSFSNQTMWQRQWNVQRNICISWNSISQPVDFNRSWFHGCRFVGWQTPGLDKDTPKPTEWVQWYSIAMHVVHFAHWFHLVDPVHISQKTSWQMDLTSGRDVFWKVEQSQQSNNVHESS